MYRGEGTIGGAKLAEELQKRRTGEEREGLVLVIKAAGGVHPEYGVFKVNQHSATRWSSQWLTRTCSCLVDTGVVCVNGESCACVFSYF